MFANTLKIILGSLLNIFFLLQNADAMKLEHPFLGCPLMKFWKMHGGCEGFYAPIGDAMWANKDKSRFIQLIDDDEYACCKEADFVDNKCTAILTSDTQFTCVYADHYCEKMIPIKGQCRTEACLAQSFEQIGDRTWIHGDWKLEVTGYQSNNRLKLDCSKPSQLLGQITNYECQNSFRPVPIKRGLNLLGGQLTHILPRKTFFQEDFRAFVITTGQDPSVWTRVWLQTSVEMNPEESVIFVQQGPWDYTRASVEFADIQPTSFKYRLRASSHCKQKHKKELLNFLVMKTGLTSARTEDQMIIGKRLVTGSKTVTVEFEKPFANVPLVLLQIQKITKTSGEQPLYPRFISSTETNVTIALESDERYENTAESEEAEIGFMAINGGWKGLFGSIRYIAAVHPKVAEGRGRQVTVKFGKPFDYRSVVFSGFGSRNTTHATDMRLVRQSQDMMQVALIEDKCRETRIPTEGLWRIEYCSMLGLDIPNVERVAAY